VAIHLSACLASVIDLIRIMLFLPYKDDNPTRSTPWVNWLLIITNVWVFFSLQFPLDANQQMAYFSNFGFIPATFFGQFFYPSVKGIMWEWYSVISSMFSHGGIAHLFGNMLFLYLLSINMIRITKSFLEIYLQIIFQLIYLICPNLVLEYL